MGSLCNDIDGNIEALYMHTEAQRLHTNMSLCSQEALVGRLSLPQTL